MPTATYDLLDSTTLASSASSVTFTSIDQSYRDLIIVFLGKQATDRGRLYMYLNSDTGANYNEVWIAGQGSFDTANDDFNFNAGIITPYIDLQDDNDNLVILQLMDYSQTDKNKSWLVRNDRAASGTVASAGRWANNSAINTIKFEPQQPAELLAAGTKIEIYGIAG